MTKFNPDPLNKIVILFPFYHYEVWSRKDDSVEKFIPLTPDSHPSDKYDEEWYDFDYIGYSRLDGIPLNTIIDAYESIKPVYHLYKNIRLYADSYEEYQHGPCIIGNIMETPEEIQERRRKYDAEVMRREQEKEDKKQRIIKNKKKKLEKLKKELENI